MNDSELNRGAAIDTADRKVHVDTDALLRIENLSKHFGTVVALDDVSLTVRRGEIFALLGPSGCGKSTLLRMIAGLENPTTGDLLLEDQSLIKVPANRRPINMVFQSYAVFPHMSVAKNIAYGLQTEKLSGDEISQRVEAALAQVKLEDLRDRMPSQLSGGQRQRVALARALVKQPRILLLDEPLSALDAKLRDQMRLELVKLQETVGVTFIIVTHDQSEAMAMADRIAVLDQGKLRQLATPEELYTQPVDTFVADFIGKVNLFDARVESVAEDLVEISCGELGGLQLHRSRLTAHTNQLLDQQHSAWQIGIRPENLRLVRGDEHTSATDDQTLPVRIGDIAFQGGWSDIEVMLDSGKTVQAIAESNQVSDLKAVVSADGHFCCWNPDNAMLLPA